MQPTPWHELLAITNGRAVWIERVRLVESGIALEGCFEVPSLATLPPGDQVFVAAFVRCHGSIKEMERLFGISYPTVKNRLLAIQRKLPLVEPVVSSPREEVLQRLERGEITTAEAIEFLARSSDNDPLPSSSSSL